MPDRVTVAPRTTSEDYGDTYFKDGLGSHEEYAWESPHWRSFFTLVADRVASLLAPMSVLDVGCARGLLVQALVERGVDAHGIDISEFAVQTAHADIQPRLRVASAVEPLAGQWDLITCVEVLEHMSPAEGERAIDNICEASDRVLLSSTPTHFGEPTHVNVRPPAAWAASFAERGFFRRTDIDLGFLTPWAVLFERAELTARDLVHRYESYTYPLRQEVIEQRAALLESERRRGSPAQPATDVQHRLLTSRDHAIGMEAEAGQLRAAKTKLEGDVARLRGQLKQMRTSKTWRVGRLIVGPAGWVRRQYRRLT